MPFHQVAAEPILPRGLFGKMAEAAYLDIPHASTPQHR
jgi:hypothetical protein